MSRDKKFSGRMRKIRFKHLKIIVPILLLCLPLATMFVKTTKSDSDVVTMIIWLETPEKQAIVDEIITSIEDLGLSVNAIYLATLDEWRFYPGDYDLSYGGIMSLPEEGDIFMFAFVNVLLNYYALKHTDTKIFKCVDKLWAMYWEAVENPDIVDEEFLDDMVNTFQDIEERLWEKQYYSVFNQWWEPWTWEWGVPSMRTEAIVYNCLPGHIFADKDLRLALNEEIDRDVFLDYHSVYNPYETTLVYHLFQWLPFHDASLPNCYPID